MKFIALGITLFTMFVQSATAAAASFDGTQPILCASVEAIDCIAGTPCIKDTPEYIGAPQFLKVDFAGKQIIGPKRTSPVLHMNKNESQILLQGMELDMGWTFSLNQVNGNFSATLSASDGVFVIFGACTTYQ